MLRYKFKKIFGNTSVYLILLAVLTITLFPLLYTFFGSFKSNMDLLTGGASILP